MKNQKGITLIALIITIIIMVILVAVTIDVALEGGLFSRAKEASSKYQVAIEKEKILAALSTWKATKESGKVKTFKTCLEEELPETDVLMINPPEETIAKVTFRDTKNSYRVSDDGDVQIDVTFAIKYELDGGTLSEEKQTTASKGETVELLIPTKENSYFRGWYLESDYSGEAITQIEDIQADTTVYAKWLNETDASYFEWTTTETAATLKKIKDTGKQELTEVAIPSTYKGLPVTTIANYAFQNDKKMEVLCIPNSVTTVQTESTFKDCSGLKELTMPITLNVGQRNWIWGGCTNLEKLNFTTGSTGVCPSYAYTYVNTYNNKETPWYKSGTKFKTVTFEEGIKNIGNCLFENCKGLEDVVLPSTLERIDPYAFNGSGLKTINIPESLTKIDNYAFSNCTNLDTSNAMYILNNGVTFGSRVFQNCTGITGTVTIDKNVVPEGVFQGCTNIQNIEMSDKVTSIANYAFQSCSGLTKVIIGNNVTSIGTESTFKDCSSLQELTMPITLNVGQRNWIWGGCTNLEKLNFTVGSTGVCPSYAYTYVNTYNNKETPWYKSGTKFTTVTFEEGIINIGSYLFENCKGLENVVLPSTLERIDSYAFNGSGLRTINIPESLTKIDNYAFQGCVNIDTNQALDLLESDVTFGSRVFQNCTGITGKVTINRNTVPEGVFQGCTGITELEMTNDVTRISNYAFQSCSGLTKVTIGNNVTSIGTESTFKDCSSLQELTMPITLNVGQRNWIWGGCTSLEKLNLTKGSNGVCPSYYYTYASSTYHNKETPWYKSSAKFTTLTLENGITNIGQYMFQDCTALANIVYNERNYTSKSAFQSVFGNNIGNNAFNNTGLSE